MEGVVRLLERAATEVRNGAPSAASVGLEPDELALLADRLEHIATFTPERIIVALRVLAGAFGDDRDAWCAISPAFVELMGAVRNSA